MAVEIRDNCGNLVYKMSSLIPQVVFVGAGLFKNEFHKR